MEYRPTWGRKSAARRHDEVCEYILTKYVILVIRFLFYDLIIFKQFTQRTGRSPVRADMWCDLRDETKDDKTMEAIVSDSL